TKCSSDTFAERTDTRQHTSAMEIAQAPRRGGCVRNAANATREKDGPTSPLKTDNKQKDNEAVLNRITAMPAPSDNIGAQVSERFLGAGTMVKPRIWYGMPGYATGRSTPVSVFFRLDDGVKIFGLTEKARVEREPNSTLQPCAWYLAEIDDPTLEKIAELVRTAFA